MSDGSEKKQRLRQLLRPASVAFVGVSTDEQKYGSRLFRSAVEYGFPGELYAVNPKAGSYAGHEFLPSLTAIGHSVDLVVVSVPSSHCARVIAEAGELGCAGAVVVATGFAEMGEVALQEEVLRVAASYGLPVIGPNSMGLVSHPAKFSAIGDASIPAGGVAVVTQSGSVGVGIYDAARRRGLGLSYFVSLGNQGDIGFEDVFAVFAEDCDVSSVLLYVEGFQDLARFLDAASELAGSKPVAVLRGGRTEAGARSAASHTASMSTDVTVTRAALRRAGLIEVSTPHDLLLAAMAFEDPTTMRGRSISVVADSGGYATLGADAAGDVGLELPPHSDEVEAGLREVLLPQASVANPVDLIGGPELRADLFQAAVEPCIAAPEIDAVALLSAFGGWEDFGGEYMAECERLSALDLVRLRDKWQKPLVMQSIYAGRDQHAGIRHLRAHGDAVVDEIRDAMFILGLHVFAGENAQLPPRSWTRHRPAPVAGHRVLREDESRRWLEDRLGSGLPTWRVATTAREAVAAAAEVGGPVVMKVLAHSAVHKSDRGGVHLNLTTEPAIQAAWSDIATLCDELSEPPLALVTGYRPSGIEALIGVSIHDVLGPTVLLGTGGVYVEAISDSELLFPPYDETEVREALGRLTLGRVLRSPRTSADVEPSFVRLACRIGELALSQPDLVELDLNPVSLSASEAAVLDARVVLAG